ncbi:MAG: FIVAR domain-containing protein, partial [Oscillospiraceae bacterium]|nr:FIVAR domain-containing protein [Oscillospiraceae bacterium]
MQDFIRKDGAITEETRTSTPGFASAGTYYLRIEKEGTTYTCYRGEIATRAVDDVTWTEMFAYEDTGIEADELLIDAYTGMTEGYKFTLKSLTFEGGSEPVHTHSYTAVVTAPTCTEKGYTTYTCACGDSYVADETPALGHNFVDGVCTRCGAVEEAPAIQATFVCDEGVSIDVYKSQAADSEVFHNATTAYPRDSATGEIDVSGNGQINFVVVIADGYKLDSITAEPASSYKNFKLPEETTVNNGYRLTKVTGNITVTVKASKAACDHDYVAVVTPATCTAQGYTTYTCSKCGDSYVSDHTAKLPHNYVDGACTVCGEKLLTVTFACGAGASVTVYETQKETGPSIENAASTSPRDGDSGLIDCSGDGQVNFVVKLAEGYTLESVTAEPAASYKNLKGPDETLIANGYRITKVKGDFTVTIATKKVDTGECEHAFTSVRVEPTCTEPAKMVYTCSKCGYSYEEDLYTAPVIETEINVPSTYTSTRSDYTYGKKESITYYSTTAGRNKNANVQLPANYDPNKKYPVMYLLHGVMGSENDMVGNGTIIQNLVADGLAEEMIIVCPNMWSSDTSASPGGINQTTMEGYDRFHLDLVNDLMPYMAEHYSVAEGKENTAVCGFSQGGRETLLIGLYHPDKIGYLCAISSAPGIVAATDQYMSHPGVFKEDEVRYEGETPYLIMMVSGDSDSVVGKNPQEYHRIYTENGIAHTWWEIPGADHGGATNSGVYNFAKYAFKVKGEGAPLGHDWETEVTAPTCTAEGYTTYTCKRCGEVEIRDYKNKAPHNYVDGVCTVCGEKLLNVAIDAGEGATVTVYETKDPKGGRIVGASSTNPRDGDTGLIDCSGDGQVNFSVKVKPGYVFDGVEVTPAGAYKNLKGPEDTGIKNGYRVTKVTGDLTIKINTTYTGEVPENADIDFTDLADVDKYEIVNQDTAECISGTGVKLTTTADAFEPIGGGFGGDATASEPKDLIKIPVSGDWTATLKFEYDQNNVTFAFNSYFAFLAMAGDDYQNMAGIRATNSTAQDFLRKDGTITTTISGGGMWGGDQGPQTGFPSNGTYWYRLEKDGETYTASRSTDGETFEEMFKLEDTGIDAEYIVIDAYKTSTFSFGGDANWLFTLKTLEFEGGEPGPVINKAALQAAIAAAEAIDTSKYTDESVAAMQSALTAAKAALSADTQAAVDAAANALTAAVNALVEKPIEEPVNYDALNAAIADAEKIDTSKYTDASVAALNAALDAAKAARTADKQADVDAAKSALDAAVNALVEKP